MHSPSARALPFVFPFTALATGLAAQVPDGHVVFGTFSGATPGIYFVHPRDTTAPPVAVTNLPQDLSSAGTGSRGVAALARRASDGALLAGERAPAGASVDFWVLRLAGNQVTLAQSFSCGTSAGAGEIPQFGQLPDGRVVLAATDLLPGGQLAQFFNGSGYNWQGLAILDPRSGAFTPIAVADWSAFTGVVNGMAVARDGQTVYLGAYISSSAGALWEVPIGGGALTLAAALPCGASNVTVDLDGTVLVTTLNGPPNLFRHDPATGTTTPVPGAAGPLNAAVVERATGNLVLATANAGLPPRALVWRTPSGVENLLQDPGLGTISGIDVDHDPEGYGAGTPGAATYSWQLEPNPGGLPELGNVAFSLTLTADQPSVAVGMFAVGLAPLAEPLEVLGTQVWIDPTGVQALGVTYAHGAVLPVPIPAVPALAGTALFVQAFLVEQPGGAFVASPAVSFTVL